MNPSDSLALALVNDGTLIVDPDLGHIFRNGRRLGADVRGAYVQIRVGRGRVALAHRIVWLSVHGHIPDGMEINHRSRVRHDNRIVNLECVTRSANQLHASGSWRYRGVRPEDVASCDPQFLAALCASLGVEQSDDPTALARALEDADATGVAPFAETRNRDDVVEASPGGEWVCSVHSGILVAGSRRRVA